MKNFSNIGNKLDITTKEYVDSKSPTALGGGAIIPGAEGVFAQITLDQIYANVFSNKKALRQVFNRVESGQMLVIGMASDGSSGVFIQHITGTIENEVTSSTSTPYESGNKGVYHFIIAEKTTSEGISERAVIWAEKSGTAYSEYHSASQGATEVFSTTVSEGWNTEYVNTETGLCNFSTLVGDGQIYWQLIQTALLRNDLGGTPQGNYFFAGSRFSIEYQSQLMQTTVLDRALGGDEDDGYFIDSINLNPNFLRSWVKYQTETAIGATITFNTKLKISTIGACLYNLFNDQLGSNSIVRELSESSIQFKIIPIVSSSADGNGDWTLCAMQLTINSITQYEIGEMSYPLTTTNPLDNFESVFDGTAWRNLSDTGVWTTNAGERVAKYINFGALSLLHQYMMFGQYNIIKLSLKDMLEAQGRYALSVENDLSSQLATKYTKPSLGIPKSDLDSSVQASLDRVIPTVNDGTLTIQKNGQTVGTFTANQKDSTTANITVPTEASDINALPISGGTVTGDLTVGGNLTVNGTTTTVDSTTLQVKDKLIEVAHGNTTKLTTPAGLVAPKYDGTNSGALVFDGDGTAYVGDVTLDSAGNIDVSKSELQPLATRTGLVGGNLVQYDSSALTLKDSGKKISDLALKTDISGKLSKTENTGVNVLGTTKSTTTLGGNQLVAPNGIIFAGTAANAGLVTRGICGVTTPDSEGACSKENLYINYDGNNDFNAGRQVVLNAGAVGNHLGSNMYQYAVPRGDIVKAWVEAKGYLTSKDISGKANLEGGNTFSGVQTINAPTNASGSEQTTMKVKTSNGGAIVFGKEGPNSGTMIRLDQADGTCRLRFRSSETAGAMVWEQPEQGAQLYVDLGKDGSDKHRVTFPSSAGTLALTSQINNGTLTIQQNGTKVQTFTANQSSSVTANITVPTKASDVNALSLDGGTINKSKTIKMDASANSDGANLKWGTVNSKNPYIGYASDQTDGTFVVGSLLGTNYASGLAIGGGSGNLLWKGAKVATTNDIPNVSGKANLSGGNTFSGQQIFQNANSGAVAECVVNDTAWDSFTVRSVSDNTQKTAISNGYVWCQDNNAIYSQFKATGIYYGNDNIGADCNLLFPEIPSGKSLEKTIATTDQIPTFSLSGTELTITLP